MDSLTYLLLELENKYKDKEEFYYQVKKNIEYLNTGNYNLDSIMNAFYTLLENSNIGSFFEVEQALLVKDYQLALGYLSMITADNIIEENLKNVFNIYISFSLSNEFTTEQKEYLVFLSEQTPKEYGRGVFIARSLLNLHKIDDNLSSERIAPSLNYGHINNNKVVIYPNPAYDYIKVSLVTKDLVKSIKITNLQGEIVYSTNKILEQEIRIAIGSFAPSLYTMELINDRGEAFRSKFIVIR